MGKCDITQIGINTLYKYFECQFSHLLALEVQKPSLNDCHHHHRHHHSELGSQRSRLK